MMIVDTLYMNISTSTAVTPKTGISMGKLNTKLSSVTDFR